MPADARGAFLGARTLDATSEARVAKDGYCGNLTGEAFGFPWVASTSAKYPPELSKQHIARRIEVLIPRARTGYVLAQMVYYGRVFWF